VALDRLTAWDRLDPSPGARRRTLGRLLGADLARASHPSRVLWRLLTQGETVRAADTIGLVGAATLAAGVDAGLFVAFEVDGELFLRSTASIVNAVLPAGERVWVACDLPWADVGDDHVPGPGNASQTLIAALAPTRATLAADVGTGCGFVALHLSTLASSVVATDVNPRALAFAELTAAINGRTWDLRQGSFLAPISAAAVDLIVANPPFVLGTPDQRAVFRDGSPDLAVTLAGDIAAALPPGGTGQYLGNWLYVGDSDPMPEILAAAGDADCLVIERAAVDLPTYVDLWVAERGDPQHRRWVANLAATGANAIGTGIVTVHRPPHGSARRTGVVRLHERTDEALGPAIAAWLDSSDTP